MLQISAERSLTINKGFAKIDNTLDEDYDAWKSRQNCKRSLLTYAEVGPREGDDAPKIPSGISELTIKG